MATDNNWCTLQHIYTLNVDEPIRAHEKCYEPLS